MNLHSVVRSQIPAVNPDIAATWRRSTGYATFADGSRAPVFTDAPCSLQVQALTGKDVQHLAQLNIQSVDRAVYMFGNPQGVARVDVRGGDLLLFPETLGGAVRTWLVVAVLETWAPDALGWGKVAVSLQVDQ